MRIFTTLGIATPQPSRLLKYLGAKSAEMLPQAFI